MAVGKAENGLTGTTLNPSQRVQNANDARFPGQLRDSIPDSKLPGNYANILADVRR